MSDVRIWLTSRGFEAYADAFKANAIVLTRIHPARGHPEPHSKLEALLARCELGQPGELPNVDVAVRLVEGSTTGSA